MLEALRDPSPDSVLRSLASDNTPARQAVLERGFDQRTEACQQAALHDDAVDFIAL